MKHVFHPHDGQDQGDQGPAGQRNKDHGDQNVGGKVRDQSADGAAKPFGQQGKQGDETAGNEECEDDVEEKHGTRLIVKQSQILVR